ncbi:MAG: hypothetical protein N2C14_02675, partial [Planctomycetales bacterium]
WSWALCAFLDGHPKYQAEFRKLSQDVALADFDQRFTRLIGDQWRELSIEWRLFIANLEYGHELSKTAVDFTPGQLLTAPVHVKVPADQGWTNTGVLLSAGETVHISATGRFQVADKLDGKPRIWESEANGVSFRYYKGRPLGMLLAAVIPNSNDPEDASQLWRPLPIGLKATLRPQKTGTLFLRINDSAAELRDNQDALDAEIRPE